VKKNIEKYAQETLNKIEALTRHIKNVEENCLILGKKLIKNGEIDLGHQLIANGFIHDSSKFRGIEWQQLVANDNLETTKLKLKMAIYQHHSTNLHHPEAWVGGIKSMSLVYLLELLCDWKARSEESGTSLMDYINNSATKRFGFDKNDEVYKILIKYMDLLCEKQFEIIK